jgi:hypothetical protein
VNVLPIGIGTPLIRLTDWIGTRTPVLRHHGGLISGTGRKRGAAVPDLEPAGVR